MHIAILILILPVLALALFFFLPLAAALPAYLIILAFSVVLDVLVVRAIKKARRADVFAMVGRTAEVISWTNASGQVRFEGTIWEARSGSGETFSRGDSVEIADRRGLVLVVKRAGS